MPILDIQRRVHEVGRIRIGEQAGDHPRALSTFRFTSPRRDLLEMAGAQFGGEVRPWNGQHEVITNTNTLDVLVPPEDVSLSQWWETWTAGGCSRRCDGVREVINDQPCVCMAEGNRRCDPITRLSVVLPSFATLGVWRLETGSWYAAGELASSVQLALQLAEMRGGMATGVLRIEHRAVKRPNEPPRRFVVPVLDMQLAPVLGAGTTPETSHTAVRSETSRPIGLDSLDVAGLPSPSPRIDRGEPSPPPTADFMQHDDDAPPTITLPNVPADDNTNDVMTFARVDAPPADPNKPLRNACFALMRDVMKSGNVVGIEADTLRYALGVLETAKRRDTPCASWNELTHDELTGVSTRLGELKRGQLRVAPDSAGGGVVFVTMSGRTAHVFMDDNGTWTWQVDNIKQEGTKHGTT